MCQVVDGDHASALAALRAWAHTQGITTIRQSSCAPLSSVFLKSLDGASDVEVQLVNPAYKTFQTPVDFNVNNLKVVRDTGLNILRLELKKPSQSGVGTVMSVCQDIVRGCWCKGGVR